VNTNPLTIKTLSGLEIAKEVDIFYGKALARGTDLFFVAFIKGELVGSVRFCVEENFPLLRSMQIKESAQRQQIGTKLLLEFENHLKQMNIKDTYCLPYAHLTSFYGQIGFNLIDESKAPYFLQERLVDYRKKPGQFICMHRQ
jgi:N-acetylglutamate synthase-like GNAT family acetyltransferase